MSNANNSLRGVILSVLRHNKDSSLTTQHNRQNILLKTAKDLAQAGHKNVTAKNFYAKHCCILRDKWEAISIATIKNRLACIRWLGEKLGKELPNNKKLELDSQVYSDNTRNKAQDIDKGKLGGLTSRQLKSRCEIENYNARIKISEELGHSREEITVQYLGR